MLSAFHEVKLAMSTEKLAIVGLCYMLITSTSDDAGLR